MAAAISLASAKRPIGTELIMAALLCAVMIGVGLYADPWIKMIGESVEKVAEVFEMAEAH